MYITYFTNGTYIRCMLYVCENLYSNLLRFLYIINLKEFNYNETPIIIFYIIIS